MRKFPTSPQAVILDVCGTLTEVTSIWRFLYERMGIWEDEGAPLFSAFRVGKMDYVAYSSSFASAFAGLPEEEFCRMIDQVPLRQGIAGMEEMLKPLGIKFFIISTGVSHMAERIGRIIKIDKIVANRLLCEDGVLTGEVEVVVNYGRKHEALAKLLESEGLAPDKCIALGDTESDIPIFGQVGYSFAVHPKSEVVAHSADFVYYGDNLGEMLLQAMA